MRDRAPAGIAVRLEANHIEVSSWRLLSVKHVNNGNVPVNPSGGNQESASRPTPSGDRSLNKYGGDGLLASSATRGWSNLTAELRSHSGTVTWNNPQPDAEICVDVRGSRSVVTRRLDGVTDSTVWGTKPEDIEAYSSILTTSARSPRRPAHSPWCHKSLTPSACP